MGAAAFRRRRDAPRASARFADVDGERMALFEEVLVALWAGDRPRWLPLRAWWRARRVVRWRWGVEGWSTHLGFIDDLALVEARRRRGVPPDEPGPGAVHDRAPMWRRRGVRGQRPSG